MLRVGTVVKGVASAIGTKLMKQITPMIKVFLKWFKANKEIIKQNLNSFFQKLVVGIRAIFNIGVRVIRVINTIVEAFGGWKVAIVGVSAALLAMNARILLVPALILAAGVAIFLLIEDMIAFANGADSQIGALAKKSETFRIIMESLVEVFSMVAEGWGLIFSDGDKALEGLIIVIKNIGQAIADFIMAPINAVTDAFESLKNKTSSLVSGAGDTLSEGVDSVSNFFGFGDKPTPSLAPAISQNSNATTNNDVVININGGDPEQVKQAVNEALGAEMKATEQNLDTKVSF